MLNESIFNSEGEKTYINGEQLADLLNMGDVYREGVKEIEEKEKQKLESFSHKCNSLFERLKRVNKQ